uniref:PDZ domain-containing protein n=1 Tax=Knipowitschia caucasica TaxID=637954 RepID=A0AAV2KNQ6_KNICA
MLPPERYAELPGELFCVELEKDRTGLGLSLAGNRDRSVVSVFVVGVSPGGAAEKDGRIQTGDQLLEINNQVLFGRSHQNASAIIKSSAHRVKLVVLRNADAVEQMAVAPFPPPAISPSVSEAPPTLPVSGPAPSSEKPRPPDQLTLSSSHNQEASTEEVELNDMNKSSAHKKRQKLDSPENPLESPAEKQALVPSLSFGNVSVAELLNANTASVSDPALCAVVPGQETLLEICKGRSGLGLSIVGGTDTQLNAIVIHEVYQEGAAARDGRLWPGDQILEVNGVSLRGASHDQAIARLRQTPSRVRLRVLRLSQWEQSVLRVTLQRRSGRGLGLSIASRRSGRGLGLSIAAKRSGSGVFVSELVRGGAAELDGRLMHGDQILSVNGEDTRLATQESVGAMLKCARGPVVLEVGRLTAASWTTTSAQQNQTQNRVSATTPDLERLDDNRNCDVTSCEPTKNCNVTSCEPTKNCDVTSSEPTKNCDVTSSEPTKNCDVTSSEPTKNWDVTSCETTRNCDVTSCETTRSNDVTSCEPTRSNDVTSCEPTRSNDVTSCEPTDTDDESGARSVDITRTPSDPLGLSVAGGLGSALGDVPLFIAMIQANGVAAKSKKLKVGDRIVSINGQSVDALSHSDVVSLLKNSFGLISLKVVADTNISAIASQVEVLSNSCTSTESTENSGSPRCRTITLHKGSDGLGFSIVGGFGSPHGDLPIYVKTVFSKGAAGEEGSLRRGDQIISVNGESLSGVSHQGAVCVLKRQTPGDVVLQVLS